MTVLSRIALGLAAAVLFAGGAEASCSEQRFERDAYIVCDYDLAQDTVRLFWKGPNDAPYGTFSALAVDLQSKGQRLDFAMNGGMYGDRLEPIGLYVEGGKPVARVNTASSTEVPAPNFYKKPNGVFLIDNDGAARVITTDTWLAQEPQARFATQSGPMLVIDGALHPAFIEGSSSRKPRNGVCAPTPTTVRFAITQGSVNFHDFGRFFRDHLGCDNALFLDGGSAPGIYAPELGRDDAPGHGGYGPIIGVVGE